MKDLGNPPSLASCVVVIILLIQGTVSRAIRAVAPRLKCGFILHRGNAPSQLYFGPISDRHPPIGRSKKSEVKSLYRVT